MLAEGWLEKKIRENPIPTIDLILANMNLVLDNQKKAFLSYVTPGEEFVPKTADFMGLQEEAINKYKTFLKNEAPIILMERKKDIDYFKIFASTALYMNNLDLIDSIPVAWTIANHFHAEQKRKKNQEEIRVITKDLQEEEDLFNKLSEDHKKKTEKVERLIDTDYFVRYYNENEKRKNNRRFMLDYAMGVLFELTFQPDNAVITENDTDLASNILYDIGNTDGHPGYFMLGNTEQVHNFIIYAKYLHHLNLYIESDDTYSLIDDLHQVDLVHKKTWTNTVSKANLNKKLSQQMFH